MTNDTHFSNAQRAEVLTQALPYIKRYNGEIVVIKYGGNAMIDETLKQQVMEDIALLWLIGVKVVLVHGGGPEISDLMKKLGKKPEFVDGLRVTDKETVDIVQMVLAGKVNKSLVTLLQMKGGHAVGLSGMDGGIIEAKIKDERLGYVGEITKVGNTSRKMKFEARKVIVSRPDINDSAADVLAEPIVVCRATGTCVTPKDKQNVPRK